MNFKVCVSSPALGVQAASAAGLLGLGALE